jgi:ABC-2 type transport system permease protein
LLFGSILNIKQVGGICGALLTNLTAWLSGVWFDLELVGGAFKKIAYCLPFVHAVELERALLSGQTEGVLLHFAIVLAYAVPIAVFAAALFCKQMKK